jgi:predicted 2-oxoglutarate/Fe(II)-dependent dioxygenase YbiX/peroxiredoxin
MNEARLGYGEPAPWFRAPCDQGGEVTFDSFAGRWIYLMFFGSLGQTQVRAAYDRVLAAEDLFQSGRALFVGVGIDPTDIAEGRRASGAWLRHFEDRDGAISRLYGVMSREGVYRPEVLLLDPLLRLVERRPLLEVEGALSVLYSALGGVGEEASHAPVLMVPRVFEPSFCRHLIEHYDRIGGAPSGFMVQNGDRTVVATDPTFKRRSDVEVCDAGLRSEILRRISFRLTPLIERAFGWRATRIERYLIACYDSGEGGFFRPHRDNTTRGTAHRRLAVTINLNQGEYDGGELNFPEFGPAAFSPPMGGAAVFGCGLLHQVNPVTRGRRYAYLPFLFDDAGGALREQNRAGVDLAQAVGNEGDDAAGA